MWVVLVQIVFLPAGTWILTAPTSQALNNLTLASTRYIESRGTDVSSVAGVSVLLPSSIVELGSKKDSVICLDCMVDFLSERLSML
jgi:hypothetical protein